MALLHVDFYSIVLGMEVPMDVILPETTNGQIGMEGRSGDGKWKTLYLLHGMSDDHTIWQRRTSIERYAADKGIAVVMPTTHLGWYTDMHFGPKYFTFITDELPKICRQMFPRMSDRREDTFVAGLSMGGYGAMKCGLRAPHMFSKVASLSGGLINSEWLKNVYKQKTLWGDIFGEPENFDGSFDDLYAAAKELKKADRPDVYMWCGTEDFLYEANVAYKKHLIKLNYNLIYEESPGDHQWKYWDIKIQTVLDWMIGEEEDA